MKNYNVQKKVIYLKNNREIALMRIPARMAERVLYELSRLIKPDITTAALDKKCRKLLEKYGGKSALPDFGFPAALCTAVNNVVAHGVPGDYRLRDGDVITLDIATYYNGWYGDCAWSFPVGNVDTDKTNLLKAGWDCLAAGIKEVVPGKRLGDIGYAIEKTANQYGVRLFREGAGHGIGKMLHESPDVMHFGSPDTGMIIKPGMVFTIEPILLFPPAGKKIKKKNWEIICEKGCNTVQFEQTVAVFEERTEVLTFTEKLWPFYQLR